ncbi:MAG: hypothetical protein PHO02_04685 [Candidatus Nanoarchaeia archaeon]|nr:hypothetical protein [Candidatus Nanoarchaeia archaeon]
MKSQIIGTIDKYLSGHDWNKTALGSGDIGYSKQRAFNSSSGLDFLDYSKKKGVVTLDQFVYKMNRFFSDAGFIEGHRDSVINNYKGDTLFVVAGIQFFCDYFHGKKGIDTQKYFISQPVIRTKFRESVGEGNVSSFVNICTVQCGASLEEHISAIDCWMNFLSSMGLYMGDFSLKLNKNYSRKSGFWANTDGVVLKFYYGGLELGDAGLIFFKDKPDIQISDLGFGLERVLWAAAKTPNFSDIIGPKPFSFENQYAIMDSVRTATLLAASGMTESHVNQYGQFKKYLEPLSVENNFDSKTLAKHYFNFWAKFLNPKRDFHASMHFLESELNKKRNMEILRRLGIVKSFKNLSSILLYDTNKFIDELRQKRLATLDQVKSAYQRNK